MHIRKHICLAGRILEYTCLQAQTPIVVEEQQSRTRKSNANNDNTWLFYRQSKPRPNQFELLLCRSLCKSACFWFRHICWILIRKIQWFRSGMDLSGSSNNKLHVSQSLHLNFVCWLLSLPLHDCTSSPVKSNKRKSCKMHRKQWMCCYLHCMLVQTVQINIAN